MLPCLSSAATPTVPYLCASGCSKKLRGLPGAGGAPAGRGGTGSPFAFNSFSSASQRRSVKKNKGGTCSSPTCAANASAPAPSIITFCDLSMTARASEMGWRVFWTSATAPAFIVAPSMIAASSWLVPSAANTAPRPALNSGLSSSSLMAVSTASTAEPPPSSTLPAAVIASCNPARYWRSASGVIDERSITPAPPCSTSAHRCVCACAVAAIARTSPKSFFIVPSPPYRPALRLRLSSQTALSAARKHHGAGHHPPRSRPRRSRASTARSPRPSPAALPRSAGPPAVHRARPSRTPPSTPSHAPACRAETARRPNPLPSVPRPATAS